MFSMRMKHVAGAPYEGGFETVSLDDATQEWVYPVEFIYNIKMLLNDQKAKYWLSLRHQFAQHRNGQSREESMRKVKRAMEKLVPNNELILHYYKIFFGPFTTADAHIVPSVMHDSLR